MLHNLTFTIFQYRLDSTYIDYISSYVALDVTVNNKLLWKEQCDKLVCKGPSTKDVRQNLGFSNHPRPSPCPGVSEFPKPPPLPGRPRPDFSILHIFQFLHIFMFAH